MYWWRMIRDWGTFFVFLRRFNHFSKKHRRATHLTETDRLQIDALFQRYPQFSNMSNMWFPHMPRYIEGRRVPEEAAGYDGVLDRLSGRNK